MGALLLVLGLHIYHRYEICVDAVSGGINGPSVRAASNIS